MGKKKQPKLFEMWGGKPTTTLLRHRDSKLGSLTLARYHRKLEVLAEIHMPTPEEEDLAWIPTALPGANLIWAPPLRSSDNSVWVR